MLQMKHITTTGLIKSIYIMILLLFAICTTSCAQKKEGYKQTSRDLCAMGYDICSIDIEIGDNGFISNTFCDNDYLYLCVQNRETDDTSGENYNYNRIYSISLHSGEVNCVDIDGQNYVCLCNNESYYSLSNNSIIKYNAIDGEFASLVDFSNTSYISNLFAVDDGYIVQGEGFLEKYNYLDCKEYSIESDVITADSELFILDGELYFSKWVNGNVLYYLINFENSTISQVASSNDFGALSAFCDGDYIFDGYSIKKIDFSNYEICILADFDKINIRPSEDRLVMPTETILIDDNHFAVINSYTSGITNIQLCIYNSEINTEYSSVIEIGGYGCREDLPLQWAVYLFNTSQSEVRAIVTDYANEGFAYNTGEEAAIAKAELIQYFNEGNAPDIFYGDAFDYNYFGRNSMVIDLMPYLSSQTDFLSESAKSLMINSTGQCYQVFSSYMLDGFFVSEDDNINNSVSFSELEVVAPINERPLMNGSTYAQILDTIIRYEIPNRVNNGGDHYFSVNELEEAISFSVQYGYPDYETAASMTNYSTSPILNLVLSGDIQAYSTYYANDVFIGYPSFGHANRVAKPFGLVAISSGCDKPDEAWEFISYLFSEDVQRICIKGWTFPVLNSVINEYRSSLLSLESSDDYSYLLNDLELENSIIDSYFDAMLSVNTVQTNDWGVFVIICDEMQAYLQGKSTYEIAESLQSRLDVYITENYS